MNSTLFISDVHLSAAQPALTALFLRFLSQAASTAHTLYILGDLFETWIGDDDPAALGDEVAAALQRLHAAGVTLYFTHGNRDFLLGERFAAAAHLQLLPEITRIEVAGESVLVLHGDSLCIDDVEYQHFRAQVRNPAWQAQILSLPLPQRRALASQLRETSRHAHADKPAEITDVNQEAVEQLLRNHGVQHLIHGHTHRPAIHTWHLDRQAVRRAVLGAWQEQQGSVLRCDAHGWHLQPVL